jgi:hypothetical protein
VTRWIACLRLGEFAIRVRGPTSIAFFGYLPPAYGRFKADTVPPFYDRLLCVLIAKCSGLRRHGRAPTQRAANYRNTIQISSTTTSSCPESRIGLTCRRGAAVCTLHRTASARALAPFLCENLGDTFAGCRGRHKSTGDGVRPDRTSFVSHRLRNVYLGPFTA